MELRANNYQPTDALMAYIGDLFGMLGQSKVVEDGFHFERRSEEAQDSKQMAPERRWLLLLGKKVLSSIHSYQDIDWETMSIPRGLKDLQLCNLFSERLADTIMDFKGIISSSQRAGWWSPSADSEVQQHADLEMFIQCQRLGCWDAGRSCWLALLGRIKYLCVRHPSYGESFYFVLGDVCGCALWGRPAELHPTPGGKEVYKLKQIESSAEIKLIVIMSLDGWEAFAYAWMPPAALHLAGVSGVGLAAMPNGSPTSLLRVSAMSAFGTLPATPLKHLAQHLQVKLAPAPTSFDIVWILVKHACPELSEDEMWVIMEKR